MKQHSSSFSKALAVFLLLSLLVSSLALPAGAQAVGTVKAKQSARTNRTATVAWSISGAVTGCEVLRYNTKSKQFESLGKTIKTAYKLSALEPGSDYLVALRPYLTAGGKTTVGKDVKLRVYTSINAVPKIRQTETTDSSHKLNWKQINGAERYQVYYYNATDKQFKLLGETGNNYATIRQLKPATLYKYRVRAISVASDGKRIKAEASKTFTAYTVPGSVKNLKALDITSTSYRLQWDAVAGASGYIVYGFDESSGKYVELTKTAAPSFTVRSLTPGTTDYYQVCAYATLQKVNRSGELTKAQAVTTRPETVTPKFVSGDPARAKLKIKWKPNENCDGYRIFATQTPGKDYTCVLEVPLAATKSAVIKLPEKCSKTYIYMQSYIITDNGRVYSDYSSALTVTSQPQPTTTTAK